MNEEDLKYYFRKIVEGFEQANNSLLSIMTNDQICFLDELKALIDKYEIN